MGVSNFLDGRATPSGNDWVPQLASVTRRRRETHDTYTLDLAMPDDATFAPFAPGQFNMLYVFGAGEAPISISGDASKRKRLTHTVRAVGALSTALTQLERGATVGVRGPYGSAWPLDAARGRDVLVIAGGLGLAPLRPALYAVQSQAKQFGRVTLLYGARSSREILYASELQKWQQHNGIDVAVTVDHATPDWSGRVGVVTNLIKDARFDADNTIALVCGPELMMRFAVAALLNAGVSETRIYLSMERNMKCAIGLCGHCQLGPHFICRDGAVMAYDRVASQLRIRER